MKLLPLIAALLTMQGCTDPLEQSSMELLINQCMSAELDALVQEENRHPVAVTCQKKDPIQYR